MEREILFRGKSLDIGEWVEGNYSITLSGRVTIQPISRTVVYEVLPTTVGQFTGLLDKNDNKIFEGDIIKFINGRLLDVRFNRETLQWELTDVGVPDWEVNHLHNTLPLSELEVETCYGEMTSEIVGNVHDNLELLKDNEDFLRRKTAMKREYIERNAVLEEALNNKSVRASLADETDIKEIINDVPSADVVSVREYQELASENRELKKLLKLAIEDIDNRSFCSMCANHSDENKCRKCKAITLDMFKWKHAEKAMKLIGGEENGKIH